MTTKNYDRNQNDINVDNKIFAAKTGYVATLTGLSFLGFKTFGGDVPSLAKGLVALHKHLFDNSYHLGEKFDNMSKEKMESISPNLIDIVSQHNLEGQLAILVGVGIGAGVLHKFVKSKTVSSLVDIYDKGIDSHLSKSGCKPRTPSEYKSELRNTFYSQSIKGFSHSCKQFSESISMFVNGKDNKKIFGKTPEFNEVKMLHMFDSFEQTEINLLHLTALLGQSDSSVSELIKESGLIKVPHVREILNNSDDICNILSDNVPNLNDFLDLTLESMDEYSQYFMKDFNNKNYRQDFDEIVKGALIKTAESHQNYAVFKELSFLIEDAYKLTKSDDFSVDKINEIKIKVDAFSNIKSNMLGSDPVDELVNKAERFSKILNKKVNQKNPRSLAIDIRDNFLKGIDKRKEDIAEQIHEKYFSKDIPRPKDNIQVEIKFQIMKALEKKVKSYFDTDSNFEDAKYKEISKSKKKEILIKLKLNPLGNVRSDEAAKEVMLKIQKKMLQRVVTESFDSSGPSTI